MVTSLEGFLGRKGDGHPETKSIWLELQRLDDITSTYKVLFPYCKFVILLKNLLQCSDRGDMGNNEPLLRGGF